MCASEHSVPSRQAPAPFDKQYYEHGCGLPYERSPHWLNFFGGIADEIVRCLKPAKVLDAGCAFGFLVESFWDRGVEAFGIDISSYAIAQVRRDMRQYCRCQSITDPFEGEFDLITCIEVLEHLRPEETKAAIENLTAHTNTILFSSTPSDLTEQTHFNVRPIIDWIELFAEFEFAPVIAFDAGFVSPHAFLLRRQPRLDRPTEMLLSNHLRLRCALGALQGRTGALEKQLSEIKLQRGSELAELEQRLNSESLLREDLAAAREELERLRSKVQCVDSEKQSLRDRNSSLSAELDSSDEIIRGLSSDIVRRELSGQLLPLKRLLSNAIRETTALMTRRRSRQIAKLEELLRAAELVASSQLFNPRWYITRGCGGNIEAHRNPVLHYLTHARKDHHNPGPAFNSHSYLLHNPDVAAAGMDPLVHYVRYGEREGRAVHAVREELAGETGPEEGRPERSPVNASEKASDAATVIDSGLFDPDWYLQQYRDVSKSGIDPLVHFLRHGAIERRNPGPRFDSKWYLENNPDVAAASLNPLLHYIKYGRAESRAIRDVLDPSVAEVQIRKRFPRLTMPAFSTPAVGRRVNLVTDSISAGSLYGGVGTAIILATVLASKIGASLRIVTREQAPDPANFKEVLAANGISCESDLEFIHVPLDESRPLPISETDIFLTTSWWTTTAVTRIASPNRIVYLLQEDERMFYPFGDDRLRCTEALNNPDIRFVVNSQLLFRHFAVGPEPLNIVSEGGLWFEPAFPSRRDFPELERSAQQKMQLFFYARPHNLRNLYWRGLETMTRAIESGVLDPDTFEFNFVGHGIGKISLPGKTMVHVWENLKWSEYLALIRRIDIGFSLMDTPHPSYPPLDLAAAGAIVVTNRHGIKTSLSHYSENIICCDLAGDALLEGIRAAVTLARDDSTRRLNYSRDHLQRDWISALSSVVRELADTLPLE